VTVSYPHVEVGPGITLPQDLLRRWYNFHGADRTVAWLERLPGMLDDWCARHRITLLPTSPPITYNLVLFGESPSVGDVVLKTSPSSPEVQSEIEALRQTAGHGMVRIIDADPDVAIMVLERVEPGTMLDEMGLDDEAATHVAAQMMHAFWRTPVRPDHLWPLETWARELLEYSPDRHPHLPSIPQDLIDRGVALGRDLLGSQRNITLLHGDLHHQNILWGGDRGWVTIDPKGLIGERGYEVATWMMNKWGFPLQPDFLEKANRRLDIFSEVLDEDRERLAQWSVFHSVLSLCWTLSDETPDDISNDIALLRSMMRLIA
jgi:streptomycin 6-kinase